MLIPTQDQLIARIEGFCLRHDVSESRLGRDALNNPAFVSGLRDGKSPTLETLNRLQTHMAEKDASAALRAKLDAPLEGPVVEAEDVPLPFGAAPVNRTGASSPTCSPIVAHQPSAAASANCRSSSDAEDPPPTAAVHAQPGG